MHRHIRQLNPVLFAPAAVCALAACRNDAQLARPANPSNDSIIQRTAETSPNVSASDVYVPAPGIVRFRVAGGESDGAIITQETRATDQYGSQWLTVESIGEDRRSESYWSVAEGGGALLHASLDHKENALTLFQPPLLLFPAALADGENAESKAAMRVVSASNPSHRKESGDAIQQFSRAGSARVQTGIGELAAVCVTVEFTADMSMAEAKERTELYINDEHGVVAQRRQRKVDILGISGSVREETLLRIEDE